MADYFDEHGVTEEQMDVESRERVNPLLADLFNYIAEEVNPDGTRAEHENTFLRLANTYRSMVEERGNTEIHEGSLLFDLIVQLLTEAREGASGPPPASKEFIAGLPSLSPKDYKQDDACPICTEQYVSSQNTDITNLPCNHNYHKSCIVPWLELHNTCPSCRYEVPSESEPKNKQSNLGSPPNLHNNDEDDEYDPMYG